MPRDSKRVTEIGNDVRGDARQFRRDMDEVRGAAHELVDAIRPVRSLGLLGIRNRRKWREGRQAEINRQMREDGHNNA